MKTKLLALCALCASGGVLAGLLFGQAPDPTAGRVSEFQKTVLPVLTEKCFSCHNEKLHTANLNLETFRDASLAPQQREVWEKVRDKLSAAKMPPKPLPPPWLPRN